jgi:hypothetical protein
LSSIFVLNLAIKGFAALRVLPLDGLLRDLIYDLVKARWILSNISLCEATTSTDKQFLKVWALLDNSFGVGGW